MAHSLETAGNHDLRHGEAVAIGLVFAASMARDMGRIDDAAVAEHRRVVAGYDLPLDVPADLSTGDLVALMGRDKKVLGDGLTFVLDGPTGVEVVSGIDPELVRSSLARFRGEA